LLLVKYQIVKQHIFCRILRYRQNKRPFIDDKSMILIE
jgi:hypothetical protein